MMVEVDIDDSIKRKRFGALHKKCQMTCMGKMRNKNVDFTINVRNQVWPTVQLRLRNIIDCSLTERDVPHRWWAFVQSRGSLHLVL